MGWRCVISKVWKGVKKAFKKVVKVLKKVVPIVLAAAAIYFTAGAALGITGAGGWTAAAGKIGAIFGEGALGATVSGAVYQAGIGAAIGGVTSKAMGGSFTKGAQGGALVGAVTGGISGYAGYTPPVAEGGVAPTAGVPSPTDALTSPDALGPPAGVGPDGQMLGYEASIPEVPPVPAGGLDQAASSVPVSTAPAGINTEVPFNGPHAPGVSGPTAANVPPPSGPLDSIRSGLGKVFGKDGIISNNQTVAGYAIQGIGGAMQGNAATEAQQAFADQRAANYEGTDPGRNYRKLAGSESRDRYDPRSYGSWEYQYDAAQGRIIKVPVGG
jgi:hypothetical protein